MPSRSRVRSGLALISLLVLAGCADYMNNRDSITLGAGNATEANRGIHTVKPFPANAHDTRINVEAEKTEQARQRYLTPCDPDVVPCGKAGEGSVTTSQ